MIVFQTFLFIIIGYYFSDFIIKIYSGKDRVTKIALTIILIVLFMISIVLFQ